MDKKTVVFDDAELVFYALNETAAEIFRLLKKGLKEEEIIEKMVKKYSIKKEKVEKDVKELVKMLKKKKILIE